MLVGYMRVSTDNDLQKTNLQKDALLKEGVDPRNIYEDKASGARDSREGLAKILNYLQKGNTLVVWKLDRLGRSLSQLLNIIKQLHEKGVAFQSITEKFDTATLHGEFFFSVIGALAQYERALIKERVVAGLKAARKRGRVGRRPRVISGERFAQIQKSLAEGMSKSAVCRTYNVKRSTLYDAIVRK